MAKATTERKDEEASEETGAKTTRSRRRTTTKAKSTAQPKAASPRKAATSRKTSTTRKSATSRGANAKSETASDEKAEAAEDKPKAETKATSAKSGDAKESSTKEPDTEASNKADDTKANTKTTSAEGSKNTDDANAVGPDGIDMFPPLVLEIDGEKITFDMDDPDLPKAIEKRQFSASNYPYKKRMRKKEYEPALAALQAELVKLQAWMLETGERVMVVFEGRDAAGKGGTIKVIREFLNPRHAPIVALTAPTKTEQGQWYYQRYVEHFPTTGELVMFDRSWYNRGVVEPVMGYCTMPEHRHFLDHTPGFERQVAADGIHLFKFWLNIGRETQIKRFHDRRHNKLKVWKLSPNDVNSLHRWDDYTAARDRMIEATHIPEAPWTVVRANDKRRARINLMRSLLSRIDYAGRDDKAIGKVDTSIVGDGMSMFGGK